MDDLWYVGHDLNKTLIKASDNYAHIDKLFMLNNTNVEDSVDEEPKVWEFPTDDESTRASGGSTKSDQEVCLHLLRMTEWARNDTKKPTRELYLAYVEVGFYVLQFKCINFK